MNRSAIKLANMDALLGFPLTSRPCPSYQMDHFDSQPFAFLDLCGAPGGFSEYIMHRFNRENPSGVCRGYGMSLLGANEHGSGTDWKLDHMVSLDGGSNAHYRVSAGSDGTGDIYNWANVEDLASDIISDRYSDEVRTNNDANLFPGMEGLVDLVVADGGFDAQRDSKCQEDLAFKMIVCETAAALTLLKRGGTFVLKMFGFQSKETRRLMRRLFLLFDKLVVVKPVLSRPASAERYIVCFEYDGPAPDWNGLAWRDDLLHYTGNLTTYTEQTDDTMDGYACLGEYLDQMDRDILALNVKACFCILSTLERKSRKARGQNMAGGDVPKKRSVYIPMYSKAWGLNPED
jgi:cap1 methyltransferase